MSEQLFDPVEAEAQRLLGLMPTDVASWPAALKQLMPTRSMGARKRIELAMRSSTSEANSVPSQPMRSGASVFYQPSPTLPPASTTPVPLRSALDSDLVANVVAKVAAAAAEAPSAATAAAPSAELASPARVMPVVLPPLSCDEEPLWYQVVHAPAVIVRARPSVQAEVLGGVRHGDIVGVASVEEHNGAPWARLYAPERNNLMCNYTRPEPPAEAFLLLDGTSLGLGTLLSPAAVAHHPPQPIWALAHRLYVAATEARDERICRVGLPSRVRYGRLLPAAAAAEQAERHAIIEKRQAERYLAFMCDGVDVDESSTAERGARGGASLAPLPPTTLEYLSCWLASDGTLSNRASAMSEAAAASGVSAAATARPRASSAGLLGTADGVPVPRGGAAVVGGGVAANGGGVVAASERPRLGIALLLRGAPPPSVAGWIAYHLAVGFHTLYLYFDDVHEAEAIAAARRYERPDGSGAVVTLCDEAYWARQRRSNLFFLDPAREELSAAGLSVANFERGDVQSRQCVVVQEAVGLATSAHLDWLLHVDIDELWYCPTAVTRQDAPAVFAAAPADVNELRFHNHEAVQRMEHAQCWFTHSTLFKVRTASRARPLHGPLHAPLHGSLHAPLHS